MPFVGGASGNYMSNEVSCCGRNASRGAFGFSGALALLLLIAWVDRQTGAASFLLLYLAPIAVAKWYAGRRAGLLMCVLATVARHFALAAVPIAITTRYWNTGIALGTFITFSELLHHLKALDHRFPIYTVMGKLLALGLGLAAALGTVGAMTEQWTGTHAAATVTVPAQGTSVQELSMELAAALRISRSVLLGSRDPNLQSCISVIKTGELSENIPENIADYDGGVGTKLAMLRYLDRQSVHNAQEDYAWHQGRLKRFLLNGVADNQAAMERTEQASQAAERLAVRLQSAATLAGIQPGTDIGHDTWPAFCLEQLNDAIKKDDLPGARRWSSELASALFAITDLHRWVDFLDTNYLEALAFQEHCSALFSTPQVLAQEYDRDSSPSMFPAGSLTLHGLGNFYEVERQAERLFTVQASWALASRDGTALTADSVWLPPSSRELFVRIEQALTGTNQQHWHAAAHTPLDCSYVSNMLWRAIQGGMADDLVTTLKRFDTNYLSASQAELLGALMYRGHSFAGLEFPDRFQPALIEAAASLHGNDEEAFQQACQWTFKHYDPAHYGATLTLRGAIQSGRLDCVRATDMIGSIFRDAGRRSFGHVRWVAGTAGHSVAVHRTSEDEPRWMLADGLNPSATPEYWPQAYFEHHAWPQGMTGNPTPWAAELYVRGLDNYIWAGAYIIRGESAGTLVMANVPYLGSAYRTNSRRVYDGPYPN